MPFIKRICIIFAIVVCTFFLFCSPTEPVSETTPSDLELLSVWQHLKVYSIHQDKILDDPFAYDSVYEMFSLLGDTLKNSTYTGFVDLQTDDTIHPYTYLNKSSAISYGSVTFDSLTDSCCYLGISTLKDYAGEMPVLDQFTAFLSKVSRFQKIVFDLRGNGGGDLVTTDSIIEMMLPAGIKYFRSTERVYNKKTRVARTNDDSVWTTHRGVHSAFRDKKFAVLINGGSASASEIIALALKDGLGAPLIGTKSYGKGIAQAVIERRNRPSLKITYAHLFRIDRTDYNRIGIEPDFTVADVSEQLFRAVKVLQPSVNRSDLHLSKYSAVGEHNVNPGAFRRFDEIDSDNE